MAECKYCGTTYDEAVRETCPNCGGSSVITDEEKTQAKEQEQHEKESYKDNSKRLRYLIFGGAGAIVIIILAIVIATAASNNKTYTYTSATGNNQEITVREIKDSIALGEDYLKQGEYLKAIGAFNKVPTDYGKYDDVQLKSDEAIEGYCTEMLDKVEGMLSSGNYPDAISTLDAASTITGSNKSFVLKRAEISGKYKADFLDRASSYLEATQYTEALATLTTAQGIFGSNDEDISSKVVEVNKARVLEKIVEYEKTEDYAEAITYLESELSNINNDMLLLEKLNTYKAMYKEQILSSARDTFDYEGYEAAIRVINTALNVLPGDSDFVAVLENYKSYIPARLDSLDVFSYEDGDAYYTLRSVIDSEGNEYWDIIHPASTGKVGTTGGMGSHSASGINRIYKIEGNYNNFTGTIILDKKYVSYKNHILELLFEVYGDGVLLYQAPSSLSGQRMEPISFDVDIAGVKKLRVHFEAKNQTNMFSWEDMVFGLSEAVLMK